MKNSIFLGALLLIASCENKESTAAKTTEEFNFSNAAEQFYLSEKDEGWKKIIEIKLDPISATKEEINGHEASLKKYRPHFKVKIDTYTLSNGNKYVSFIAKNEYQKGLLAFKIIKEYKAGDTIDLVNLEKGKPIISIPFYKNDSGEWKILK